MNFDGYIWFTHRNYVVQFILELKIPSAAAKLVSQFEGNYVHLSTQKFSSHVVEKCLVVCNNEVRSKIIHELLLATHFEQLLQDPHANYVVQTALKVSEVRQFTFMDLLTVENFNAVIPCDVNFSLTEAWVRDFDAFHMLM